MKRYLTGILVITLVSAAGFLFCGAESVVSNGNYNKMVVGEWGAVIKKMPLAGLEYDILVDIFVEEGGTSVIMDIIENDPKRIDTLYINYGKWETGEHPSDTSEDETFFIYGDSSFVLDTSASPDTLQPVPDSTAKRTVLMEIQDPFLSENTWVIMTKSILPFLVSLPIEPDVLLNFFPAIRLTRKKD